MRDIDYSAIASAALHNDDISDGVIVDEMDEMPTLPFLRVTRYGTDDQCPECRSHEVADFDLGAIGQFKHCMSPISDGCGTVWEVKS